jgi:MYXO-CTERM domain-containing protein
MAIGSSHTLTARLTDAEGNVTTSAPVTVTITEAPDDGCGCRSAQRGPATPALAGLVLLALMVRPRRRRRLE